MNIILASQSPRRKALLEQMGIKDYEVIVSQVTEMLDSKLTIQEQVKKLSYQKAKKVFEQTEGDRIVIGADTIVEKNNQIYGKPKDRKEAKIMLNQFKNSKVNVITGMTVLMQKQGETREEVDSTTTEIFIKDMTEQEIEKWLDTGKAMDKAGAFSIQDEFCVYIEKIVGDVDSAVGLSTNKLYDIIAKKGGKV